MAEQSPPGYEFFLRPEADAALQRALEHMVEAISLLDKAEQSLAAALLQNAIDVLCGKVPHPH
jgi:hypothetical protein